MDEHCIEEVLMLLEFNHGGAAGTGRNEKFVPLPLDPSGDDASTPAQSVLQWHDEDVRLPYRELSTANECCRMSWRVSIILASPHGSARGMKESVLE